MKEEKIIVIIGPTASGKTDVAIRLAEKINGEIISADSRTIYQGMDIGTAKPTLEERRGIAHYGFDLIKPDERFTVYDWKQYALEKIKKIRAKGKNPIIVGGTGLYIDALIFDYQFNDNAKKNCTDREKMLDDYSIYGIKWEMAELKQRILKREQQMFAKTELFDETERLALKYEWNYPAMKSNVYKYVWRFMRGVMTREEAITQGALEDYHLAKRQMTWFKRNKAIKWHRKEDLEKEIMQNYERFSKK